MRPLHVDERLTKLSEIAELGLRCALRVLLLVVAVAVLAAGAWALTGIVLRLDWAGAVALSPLVGTIAYRSWRTRRPTSVPRREGGCDGPAPPRARTVRPAPDRT